MATLRERPCAQFNFLVNLGDGQTDGGDAGFEEVGRIGMELPVIEYRNGNSRENSVIKLTGLAKANDVSFRRGVIGSLKLYRWLDQIRNGDQQALRTVTVQLMSEDHGSVVQTWKLLRARIVKHVSGLSQCEDQRGGARGDGACLRAARDGLGQTPSPRDRPCLSSNFRVEIDEGNGRTAEVGVAEVVFPTFRAAPGTAGPGDAAAPTAGERRVLRRAWCGSLDLCAWWHQARKGRPPRRRTVRISLLAEDHQRVVMGWRFRQARPVALGYSPLSANASALLIESIEPELDLMEMFATGRRLAALTGS
jgi:phage tail-like protein